MERSNNDAVKCSSSLTEVNEKQMNASTFYCLLSK